MAEQVTLSWGKPTIKIDDTLLPYTPVEGSTQLTVNKGDKVEALIEGGEVEAVKYKKSKSQLVFNIRRAKGRRFPLQIKGGVCPGEHTLELKPEEAGAPGFKFPRGSFSVDETYTPADGAIWAVTVDALYPSDGTEAVVWDEVVSE